jgi:hypothetical protein
MLRNGMQMSGSWVGNGFNNIQAVERNASIIDDKGNVIIGNITTGFGNDGKINQRELSNGLFNGVQGNVKWDGEGNAVWTDTKSGSSVNLGQSTAINQDTLLAIAKGDKEALKSINFFDMSEEARDSVMRQTAHTLGDFIQQNISEGTNYNGEWSVYLDVSGKVGLEVLGSGGGVTVGGKTSIGGSMFGSTNSTYNQISMVLQNKENELSTAVSEGRMSKEQADAQLTEYLGNIYSSAEKVLGNGAFQMFMNNNRDVNVPSENNIIPQSTPGHNKK